MEKLIKVIPIDNKNRIVIYKKMRSGGHICFVPIHQVRSVWTFGMWIQEEILLVNWERVQGLYSVEECEKKAMNFIENYNDF